MRSRSLRPAVRQVARAPGVYRHVALAGRAALRGRPAARPACHQRHEPGRVLGKRNGGRGEVTGQWSPERANEWFASIPLPFGCNFLPSTAVNSTEMWQADSFGPATIERELQLAAGLGYNTVRVFPAVRGVGGGPGGPHGAPGDLPAAGRRGRHLDDARSCSTTAASTTRPLPRAPGRAQAGGAQQPLNAEPRLRHRRRPGALAAARSARRPTCTGTPATAPSPGPSRACGCTT